MTNKQELHNIARESLREIININNDYIAKNVVDSMCDIILPNAPHIMELIILDSKSAISVKPGNILLNWRKLFDNIPDVVLTGAGVEAAPWLWPFAGLAIWNKVWSQIKIDLSEYHAVSMYAMWKNKNNKNCIDLSTARRKTNEILKLNNKNILKKREFYDILQDLTRMKCIEIDKGEVWLREWVIKKY